MADIPKYLITGGMGLIGSAIARDIGKNVTILTRTDKQKDRVKDIHARIICKDIRSVETADVEGHCVIYHCASTVHNYHVQTDPYIDMQTNVEGTLRLVESIKNLQNKPKVIFLSTFFVYGNTYDKTKQPISEESKTDPLALYPATKLCAEQILKLYAKLYAIPYLIVRLTNVYSEYESFENKKKGALNYLIMRAVKGEQLQIYRGGNFRRDYIHVDDVVSALRFLETRAKNETLLVGTGSSVYFKDIIQTLHTLTGNRSEIVEIEPPDFHKIVGITNFVSDTHKLTSAGWSPKIDYKEGLRRIVKYYQHV